VPGYDDTEGLRRGNQMRALYRISITGDQSRSLALVSSYYRAAEWAYLGAD
jgi:hypothetical protein